MKIKIFKKGLDKTSPFCYYSIVKRGNKNETDRKKGIQSCFGGK